MDVSRLYETDTPIAYGKRSKIFDISYSSVVKVYMKGYSEIEVREEYDKTLKIALCTNLPVPKPLQFHRSCGYCGIELEKVNSVSSMDLMMERFWRLPRLVKMFLLINEKIHACHVDIVDQESFFLPKIYASDRLDEFEKRVVSKAFKEIHTDDPRLCHGDFHQGNVLTDGDEFYIIDWMDAFSGNPLLDIALTSVNAVVSDAPGYVPAWWGRMFNALSSVVPLDQIYMKMTGVLLNDRRTQAARLVAAAIHLVKCKDLKFERHKRYFSAAMHTSGVQYGKSL